MFIHHFDALVTRDYLDARLDGPAARIDSLRDKMNTRFEGFEFRIEAGIDARFDQFAAEINVKP